MKPLFVFIVLLIFNISCQPGKTPPREYLIQRDSLVTILVDLHLVHSIQSTVEYRQILADYDSIDLYSKVFSRHGTTKAAFDSTISYYANNPEELLNIYDEVIMQLTMMQDSLQSDR
jgi:hypothetical protein